MLVLSRKTGEQIVIAGNIRVVVLSAHKDRVRLGFDAPSEVPIHREEVYQRIAQDSSLPPVSEGERGRVVGTVLVKGRT